MKVKTGNIGLSAFILQNEEQCEGKYSFNSETREYEIESVKSIEQWEIIYDRSSEKVHDQIVMRIRGNKRK